ncbi:TlpA family protein disulfide reductase [Mucilaginibacter limnophilus]|uniref:TlpA family protein disulfide reductase n=1 Tax=Mucilaginibacter limnophilus TaxID=1932778 RepID=A0A437MQ25_9SPHI|nr:TlpA disulfide reductase family protein [Mucilaginibacter limnophilus]RVT99740.1 TlpA family protein disulfide reductase [Mucilaginibacter limnophilus]
MKHKIRFPGSLLPFRKQLYYPLTDHFYRVGKRFIIENLYRIAIFFLWLLVWFIIPAKCGAQQITPVKQGEKVPEMLLENIINFSGATANIADFRGKLLILDFWESWCKGCLLLMPKVKSLQKTYGDRIQILAVSAQSAQVIEKIAQVNSLVKDNPIPMITGDHKLAAMFPHKLVPHLVWIGTDGIYLGATDQSELSAVNIDHILLNGKAAFSEYKNDLLTFDADKPIFNSSGFGDNFLFKSAISPYQPGVPEQSGLDNMGKQLRMYGINTDLFRLYCLSLHLMSDSFPPNRIIYSDTTLHRKFRYDPKLRNRESMYCYELIVPAERKELLRPLMRSDLLQATGIKVSLQRHQMNCYILRRRRQSTQVTAPHVAVIADDIQPFKWTNELTSYLNNLRGMPPVIDETGGDVKLNAVIRFDNISLEALNEKLRPHNLVLSSESRELDMLFVDTLHNQSSQLTE